MGKLAFWAVAHRFSTISPTFSAVFGLGAVHFCASEPLNSAIRRLAAAPLPRTSSI